ncbi:MAG: SPOR domain-containing protein [Pseudomonadota bacterium]
MADRYQNRAYPLDDGYGRQQAQQQPSAESDPLAELARLIGQSDPFNNFGKDARPAPSRDTSFSQHAEDHDPPDAPPPGPPSWMQRMRQNAAPQQPAYEDAADERGYHQSPSFAPAEDVQPDPSRYDNVLYGQHDQGYGQDPRFEQPHAPNFAGDQYAYQDDAYVQQDESDQKPRRGGLLTVAVVIALGVVGTAGAYAYRSFVSAPRSGEPPVIKADTGPTKIVPPANQPTDGSKLIYDRIGQGGSTPERVVSREEQPLDVNKNAGPRVVFPPLNQVGSAAAAPAAGGARPTAAPATAQSEEPRKVRTLSIRPDQAEPAPAPAPAKQPPRAAAPPPAPSANANASANGPLSLSPQGAPQRTASTTTSAPPAAASGNYVVQVSSQRSEADAQASYRALQSKYPSVLGSRSASIRRADLGDRGVYYRAMVGPFGSSEDATRLCDSLKAAGGQCNIMRN